MTCEKHTRYMTCRDLICGRCQYDFKLTSELESNDGIYCCFNNSSFNMYCEKCYKQCNIETNIKFNNIEYKFEKIEETLNKLLNK